MSEIKSWVECMNHQTYWPSPQGFLTVGAATYINAACAEHDSATVSMSESGPRGQILFSLRAAITIDSAVVWVGNHNNNKGIS